MSGRQDPGVADPGVLDSASATTRPDHARALDLLVETLGARPLGLVSLGAGDEDRAVLAAHLARSTLQGCPDRDFARAWQTTSTGESRPRLHRIGSTALSRCQYVALTHPQRAAVVVVDVDRRGSAGGQVENLCPEVYRTIAQMTGAGAGPAWIGVNPLSGKAQLIWLIDPVYAGQDGDSPNTRLLKATTTVIGDAVGGDPAFAHALSRSPFYTGSDPTAYRWHCQHHRVDRLGELIEKGRAMTGEAARSTPRTRGAQTYGSGRELLEAVQARRAEAATFKAVADELAAELPDAAAMDGDRVNGVRVLWTAPGRAARDETAFRHALAEAHRLREAGQRMSDAKIIDAYERAYAIAHLVGADGRVEELPPMRDRLTMARRVRTYVVAGRPSRSAGGGPGETGRATSRERKALATLGRRGGQRAAQRWADRDSDYARGRLEAMARTHRRKRLHGQTTRARILALIGQQYDELGTVPTRAEIMADTGLSRATVGRHLAALRSAGLLPE
ncbi:replicase RepA [Nocardia farcinica]|nr:replicase RepA [Nocardia farcinica]